VSREPNQVERAYRRNRHAARAAAAREAADPWERACQIVRDLHAPPSVVLMVDALEKKSRQLGKKMRNKPVLCGYGGRKRGARERGLPEDSADGLAELTGRHRRTMGRARLWVAEHQVLNCRPGGGEAWREARRDKADQRGRWYWRGKGGCMKEGIGLANAYWPAGMADPAELSPATEPTPPPVGVRPPAWERVMAAQRERELAHQRRRAGEQASRGP
jgi:hypothetical protein